MDKEQNQDAQGQLNSYYDMRGQLINFEVFNQIRDEAYAVAKSVGFHATPLDVSAQVANLHGEVSELYEAYRRGQMDQPCDKASKMIESLDCQSEELADLIIRTANLSFELGVDLGRAIRIKNAFNKTRPFRNGGKLT